MKRKIVILIVFGFLLVGCSDFLEVDPIAQETEENFFEDPENAVYAINAIYDVVAMYEGPGPDFQWLTHNYEFFYGDMLSDDSEKGSLVADIQEIQEIIEWRSTPGNSVVESTWIKMYDGIYRANNALKQLETSSLNEDLRTRLMGEAYFLRGYFYFYLVKVYGGVPVITTPVTPSEYGNIPRASYHESFEQVASDFSKAVDRLPLRYEATNLGRATKGAARTFLARTYMYQKGMDSEASVTWQDVYDQTKAVINSGQYSLISNYAVTIEWEGQNQSGSIFELQLLEGNTGNQPEKVGSNFHQFQGNRQDWGWGFNNPTQLLFDAFEPEDPRLSTTVYGPTYNNGVVHAVKRDYNINEQGTEYLNRKAALQPVYRPALNKSSGKNLNKARYAEVLLMHAEAAYHLGMESEARAMLEMVRSRARNSTFAKGFNEGSLDYPSTGFSNNLPEVTASGENLLEAIWHERRVELAMEALRYWDLVRTGRYMDALKNIKNNVTNPGSEELKYSNVDLIGNAQSKSIQGPNGPVPLLPIPLREQQDWNLEQNPGY